ncbi:MAG: hypothetical protein HYV63_13855 [Candidatus Schekmanbacteria bacterium]|nr:hypothetical protein [Candidatus Schekmanbacteria bacterium]
MISRCGVGAASALNALALAVERLRSPWTGGGPGPSRRRKRGSGVATTLRRAAVLGLLAGALALAPGATPGRAASTAWAPIGPYGGPLLCIAIDPANPVVRYAGSAVGIFKSTDEGTTWFHLTPTYRNLLVTELVIAPDGALWAVASDADRSGLLRSSDAGASWTWVPLDPLDWVWWLVADPANAATLYVSDHRSGGIYRTTDGGATWQPLLDRCPVSPTGSSTVNLVAIDPLDTRVLYAFSAQGLCKSSDAGATWSFTDMGIPPNRLTTGLGWFTLDPGVPGRIYAGLGNWGLSISTDGGATWAHQSPFGAETGHPINYAERVVIDSVARSTIYDLNYRSTDAGATWVWLEAGEIYGTACSSNLAAVPGAAGGLTATSSRGGVCRSSDGGTSWTRAAAGLHTRGAQYVAADPFDAGSVYVGASGIVGLFKTTDGGASWSVTGDGAPEILGFTPEPVVDPMASGRIYSRSTADGLWRSTDGGASWLQLGFGDCFAPSHGPDAFAIHPGDSAILLAGSWGNELCRSTDAGGTWASVNPAGPSNGFFGVIDFDDARPADVYAGMAVTGGVWKSTDGGLTWFQLVVRDISDVDELAVHPVTPGVVLVSGENTRIPRDDYFLRSTDGGATWSDATAGWPGGSETPAAMDILGDPTAPGTFYAAVNYLAQGGVYRSTDGGLSWAAIREGLFDIDVWQLALSTAAPARLYAAANDFSLTNGGGAGVFSIDLPVTEPVPAFGSGAALLLLAPGLHAARRRRQRAERPGGRQNLRSSRDHE